MTPRDRAENLLNFDRANVPAIYRRRCVDAMLAFANAELESHLASCRGISISKGDSADLPRMVELIGKMHESETNFNSLGLIASFRFEIRKQAIADCITAIERQGKILVETEPPQ